MRFENTVTFGFGPAFRGMGGPAGRHRKFLRFIQSLEELRAEYNWTGNKALWDSLIRQLPGSWLQTRTVNMNYENLRSVVHRGTGASARSGLPARSEEGT